MSLEDSRKQDRIQEFLRKSLLGEEVVNTQFHLFSAKSVPSSRVTRPRVLCANNVLLANSSKYFLDMLSSDIATSDPSLSDVTDANDIPADIPTDDYSYESDSDLDEDEHNGEHANSTTNIQAPRERSATIPRSPPQIDVRSKDDKEPSDGGSESDGEDVFVMSPEHPRTDIPFSINIDGTGSVASSETAVQDARNGKTAMNHAIAHLRSLGSRHILVKDTAFQTWYTLLNYLYTGKISFLPLTSTVPEGQFRSSTTSTLDEPRCSAKSMYRLSCKVGLDDLRDEALAHVRNDLSEQNILKEISCSLASKHSQLLDMELDVLYGHIASSPVVGGFAALAQRIANKELPHGGDIVVGIHARLLKERVPFPPMTAPSPLPAVASPPCSPLLRNPSPPFNACETQSPIGLGLDDATENVGVAVPVDKPASAQPGFGFESWPFMPALPPTNVFGGAAEPIDKADTWKLPPAAKASSIFAPMTPEATDIAEEKDDGGSNLKKSLKTKGGGGKGKLKR